MSKRILVLALSIGVAASASAQVISVNMTDGGSNGTSPAQTAGAVLAGSWNEIAPSGAAIGTTDLSNLLDDSNAASGVSLVQSAWIGGWYASSGWPTGFSGTLGNDMIGSFSDTDFAYTYTFDNLTAAMGAEYDVYIYSARGFGNTGVTQFDVDGDTKFLHNRDVVGDYAESGWASQALAEANPDSGNYVRFQNVTLDTLVIGIDGLASQDGGVSGSVAGVQIVAVPEPATFGLLAVFGGAMLFLRRTRNY